MTIPYVTTMFVCMYVSMYVYLSMQPDWLLLFLCLWPQSCATASRNRLHEIVITINGQAPKPLKINMNIWNVVQRRVVKGERIGAGVGVWQQRRLVGHKPPNEPNKCYLYKNV